jgi:rod shape-determining protein MreC
VHVAFSQLERHEPHRKQLDEMIITLEYPSVVCTRRIMRDYLDNRPIKLRQERLPASWRPYVFGLLLCVLAVILWLLDTRGLFVPVRGFVQQGLSPITRNLTGLRDGIVGFWTGVGDVRSLREENEALKQQVSSLEADLIAYKQDKIELERLRQQLDIQRHQPWLLRGAEVNVRSPDAGRRVITIDRGSNDGIKVGMAVVGQTGSAPAALIGVVEAIGPRTADVLLITDIGSQISGRVLHDNDTALGLILGQWQRGSRLRLEQLEREARLSVGDAVVSAGLSRALHLPLDLATVPAGIPIGSIESIDMDGPERIAELRPYVDPDQVRNVWVIIDQND